MTSALRPLLRTLTLFCLCGLSAMAHAARPAQPPADPRGPIEQYRYATIVRLGHCHYTRLAAERNTQLGQPQDETSDVKGCLDALRNSAPKALAQAIRASRGKGLQQAVRNFHGVFLKGLTGFERQSTEDDDTYQARQMALVNEINASWDEVENLR